jgi:hypothetical protein
MNQKTNDITLPKHIAESLLAILRRTAPRSTVDQDCLIDAIELLNKQLTRPKPPLTFLENERLFGLPLIRKLASSFRQT